MRLEETVERSVEVGFQCDVCHKKYSSGATPTKEWPHSFLATLSYDAPDGGWEHADICAPCYSTIKSVIITLGGKITSE